MNWLHKVIRILAYIIIWASFFGINLPIWWLTPLALFILAIFNPYASYQLSPGKSFFVGFLLISLLWTVSILFADIPNHHILSSRMAMLFNLPNYVIFLIVNIFLGGLIGGLSAWSGALVRKAFFEDRPSQPAVIPK